MKDLLEAINTRVKEPYWGFFLLSFIAFNWRGLFLLCFATGTAQEKIALFDAETTFSSLIVFPIITALVIMLVTPWLRVLFGWVSRLAYEKLNSQALVREHKYIAEKNKLEKERAVELANKENELIDQAKRDEDIEKIEDETVKENLKREIDQLRKDRQELKNDKNSTPNSQIKINSYEKKILDYLALDEHNFIRKEAVFGEGLIINLGNTRNSKNDNNREYLKFEEAIFSLIDKGILYDLRNEGEIFELTNFGRDFVSNSKSL